MKAYNDIVKEPADHAVGFRFEAAGGPRGFLLLDSYCEDPLCQACDAHVVLLPERERRDRDDAEPIAFWLSLGEAAEPRFEEPATPAAEAVATELADDPEARLLLERRHQIVRAWGLSQWDGPVEPAEDHSYGLSDFAPHDESFLIPLRSGDQNWLVRDQYCANPDCPCKEAALSFHLVRPGARRVSATFDVRLDLDSGQAQDWDGRVLNPSAGAILETLKETLGDWRGALMLRRGFLRATARRRLDHSDFRPALARVPVSVAAKPMRNEPCPCGSGRKYKKCCGAVR